MGCATASVGSHPVAPSTGHQTDCVLTYGGCSRNTARSTRQKVELSSRIDQKVATGEKIFESKDPGRPRRTIEGRERWSYQPRSAPLIRLFWPR